MLKRILKILLIVLIILILVIAGYVVYVFASYHRAEDNITLEVEGKAQESALPVCRTLTAVTYNLGFGAYSDDFSFFMDGGDESRCRTEESAVEIKKLSDARFYRQTAPNGRRYTVF